MTDNSNSFWKPNLMYTWLKSILKVLLPKKLLFSLEPYFRKCSLPFYAGHQFQCTVCNAQLKKFVTLPNQDLLCPGCGSISRNRRLWQLLESTYLKDGIRVLDFSPSRNLFRKLTSISSIKYSSSDLSGDFIADYQYDITNINCPENQFDLILCFHILEHIPDDRKAMTELLRVMKPNGIALIQTPFKDGDCYENEAIRSPEQRKIHFGQEDHVRIYSVKELCHRLQQTGFQVRVLNFSETENNRFGFSTSECIIEVTK